MDDIPHHEGGHQERQEYALSLLRVYAISQVPDLVTEAGQCFYFLLLWLWIRSDHSIEPSGEKFADDRSKLEADFAF